MAKSVQERCDKIIGSGSGDFMAIAGYKVGEGEAEEGRYAYGVNFDYPDFTKITEADRDKLFTIAIDRVRSVSQAPFKAKILAGEMTQDEVEAWFKLVDGEAFITFLNTVKEKVVKEKTDTISGAIITQLVLTLKNKVETGWDFATAKVAIPGADNPPKMAVGKDKKEVINYRAWAKLIPATHPWFIKVKADLEKTQSKMD